jgi:HSP20 family protein
MIKFCTNLDVLSVLETFFDNSIEESKINEKSPKVPIHDIIENDNEFQVEMLLAGIKKEDINIDVDKNILTIKAERSEIENLNFNRKQSYFGKYERKFTLPDNIDSDNINAALSEGILTIKIPKQIDKVNKKQIQVN